MNQPIETYTFSRALHLMRYGGKKMRAKSWDKYCNYNLCVTGEKRLMFYTFDDVPSILAELSPYEIMGEWVEVK